jgi:hypothetical protein
VGSLSFEVNLDAKHPLATRLDRSRSGLAQDRRVGSEQACFSRFDLKQTREALRDLLASIKNEGDIDRRLAKAPG